MIIIDGSFGEGGGQIVRTSLTMSMLTKEPVKIINIRKNRKNPGLSNQHLTCVKASAKICDARVAGAELRSSFLEFYPGETMPGNYDFEINSAGSVGLVIQTIFLPLVFCKNKSSFTITGGTHVPNSPNVHYIDHVFAKLLEKMGVSVKINIVKWGWHPKGGGKTEIFISPQKNIIPFVLTEKKPVTEINAISAISNLPEHVMTRQARFMKNFFLSNHININIKEITAPAFSRGSLGFCYINKEKFAGFTGLGKKGKRAEKVAEESSVNMLGFINSGANVDERLSDQIILPALFSSGESSWTTTRITEHLKTNIWTLEKFFPGITIITQKENGLFCVNVKGIYS